MASNYRKTTKAADQFQPTADNPNPCPLCGARMEAMKGKMQGRGWNCSQSSWSPKTGRTGCAGVRWANSGGRWKADKPVARPEKFPALANPSDEQKAVRDHVAKPQAVGGMINAGAGCGKTTTFAWVLAFMLARLASGLRSLVALCAFNRNARAALQEVIPASVPGIYTINAFGLSMQDGFGKAETRKVYDTFKSLPEVAGKEFKERPAYAPIGQLIDRMRDNALYLDDETDPRWRDLINAVVEKYPSNQRAFAKNAATVYDLLPKVYVRTVRNEKVGDLTEQWFRPVVQAIRRTGWFPSNFADFTSPDWTPTVPDMIALVRAIKVPPRPVVFGDEAQDWCAAQIALLLASVGERGEFYFVGDSYNPGDGPGSETYRAGQGIYAWRGALRNGMRLVAECLETMRGQPCPRLSLNETFRFGPEIADAVHSLNPALRSGKPYGGSWVRSMPEPAAYDFVRDLDGTDPGKRALWVTRTNKPHGPLLLAFLRDRVPCCIRNGDGFLGRIDSLMTEHAGFCDKRTGEYALPLAVFAQRVEAVLAERNADSNGTEDPDSVEEFVADLAREVLKNPALLAEAKDTDTGLALPAKPTVANLRRFIAHFANADARVTITTVYRCKGDTTDYAIVGDTQQFNNAWNGDEVEAAACRYVACTRPRTGLIVCGPLRGVKVAADAPEAEPVAEPEPKDEPKKPAAWIAAVAQGAKVRRRNIQRDQPSLFETEPEPSGQAN